MANPQPTDAHLRIAHSINEQVMVSDFTKRQRKILDLILRLSWGCGKKEAIIPRQKDFEIVGVYETDIKQELDWLIEARVIFTNGTSYQFNKDYDQWRVSRAKKYTQTKLSELLRLNLKENHNNLVKYQVGTLQNTKKPLSETLSTPDTNLATAKENIKKDNNIYIDYIDNKELISGQSVEKAKAIARGEYTDASKRNIKVCQDELKRRGISWG